MHVGQVVMLNVASREVHTCARSPTCAANHPSTNADLYVSMIGKTGLKMSFVLRPWIAPMDVDACAAKGRKGVEAGIT